MTATVHIHKRSMAPGGPISTGWRIRRGSDHKRTHIFACTLVSQKLHVLIAMYKQGKALRHRILSKGALLQCHSNYLLWYSMCKYFLYSSMQTHTDCIEAARVTATHFSRRLTTAAVTGSRLHSVYANCEAGTAALIYSGAVLTAV